MIRFITVVMVFDPPGPLDWYAGYGAGKVLSIKSPIIALPISFDVLRDSMSITITHGSYTRHVG